MMGWGYQNMMGGVGLAGSVFSVIVLVDLVLLGIWLWQQIQKK